MVDAYAICAALNGRCACRDHDTGPCDAILLMALNDEGPGDELARIEEARQEAEGE